MSQIAGVVGAEGDLGSQVVTLLKEHGFEVLENDIASSNSVPLEDLLERSNVVHFCIPADAVPVIGQTDALLALHDSVMSSSEAASATQTDHKAVPVHMLMNDTNTVIVANQYDSSEKIAHHFEALGMHPTTLTIAEHDRLMARTQAPLVILIDALLPDLREWSERGLLTPSATELLESLESRAARWTEATTRSILKNQEIDVLIEEIAAHRKENNLPTGAESVIKELWSE